jgi:hypoxanthine phosphoribosyltransferase
MTKTEANEDKGTKEHLPGEILISNEEIQARLQELAKEIAEKYHGQKLMLVGVLKGAAPLTTDFSRKLYEAGLTDAQLDFIRMESYTGTEQGKELRIDDMNINVLNRNVLLVDDIFDSGRSLKKGKERMLLKGARGVEILTLLNKRVAKQTELIPKYIGFEIDDVWVEGYGMDTDERGRGNPHIIYGPSKI